MKWDVAICISVLYTCRVVDTRKQEPTAKSDKDWQKTHYANLIRYIPSGTYYARLRVRGKLIRRSLKTDVLTVAKLRLSDFEKAERSGAETKDAVSAGRMNVGDAIAVHKRRIAGDASLKPATRDYHDQRIVALLKSWPGLETREMRGMTKSECLDWAARFGTNRSATAFNHTISILRKLFEIGIEMGARYDNPARFIKRASERLKQLLLPEIFNLVNASPAKLKYEPGLIMADGDFVFVHGNLTSWTNIGWGFTSTNSALVFQDTNAASFLRKRRGDLTFKQFSRKIGISDSTLHRMEMAEQNVTLKTLEQICSRLKCRVTDIFED
jgi:DNA-binding Xre family transcriptional regulator